MNTDTESFNLATGWFKSTFSNPSHACVEVNFDADLVHIRDSKDHGAGPVITIGGEHWDGLLAEAMGRAEVGSNHAVRIEVGANGGVEVHARDRDVTLAYTGSEWAAFVAGIADGEFDLRHSFDAGEDRRQGTTTLAGVHAAQKTVGQ